MRIVSGINRGKEIISPKGRNTRPTSDRIRESIFNILRHGLKNIGIENNIINNATVLDCFAGTGALGLEALSQGAKDSVFVENNQEAFKICKENIFNLNEKEHSSLIKHDSLKYLKRPKSIEKRSLIFLDPPYGKDMGIKSLISFLENDWLYAEFISVLEMSKKEPEKIPDIFNILDERTYGITTIVFLNLKTKNNLLHEE